MSWMYCFLIIVETKLFNEELVDLPVEIKINSFKKESSKKLIEILNENNAIIYILSCLNFEPHFNFVNSHFFLCEKKELLLLKMIYINMLPNILLK